MNNQQELILGNHFTSTASRGTYRLVNTQKRDGGWQWMNPDTNPNHGVPTPPNTLGVTAQGILCCHKMRPRQELIDACDMTFLAMTINSRDPDPAKHRIRGPDISFLVELSEVKGVKLYADFAKARWLSVVGEFGGGTPRGFAEYVRDYRKAQNLPALISWDVNLYIQGVLALHRYFPNDDYLTHAQDMAEVIYRSLYVPPVDFDINDDTQSEFWCGIAGAVEAFITVRRRPKEAEYVSTQLAGRLVNGQQDDGHFVGVSGGSDVQTTAYGVMALIKVGQEKPVLNAIDYLTASQLGNGGWNYDGGENTEVTSEAIHAICDYLQQAK